MSTKDNKNVIPTESCCKESLDVKIHRILNKLGILPSTKGYIFLFAGIKKVMEDRKYIGFINRSLYPYIADAYNTTPLRVERAMRYAIHTMPESDFRFEVFNHRSKHYSIKEFIVLITNYIYYN